MNKILFILIVCFFALPAVAAQETQNTEEQVVGEMNRLKSDVNHAKYLLKQAIENFICQEPPVEASAYYNAMSEFNEALRSYKGSILVLDRFCSADANTQYVDVFLGCGTIPIIETDPINVVNSRCESLEQQQQ